MVGPPPEIQASSISSSPTSIMLRGCNRSSVRRSSSASRVSMYRVLVDPQSPNHWKPRRRHRYCSLQTEHDPIVSGRHRREGVTWRGTGFCLFRAVVREVFFKLATFADSRTS